VVTTDEKEVVSNVTMVASFASGKRETLTGTDGSFRLRLPNEPVKLKVIGKYLVSEEKSIDVSDSSENLQLRVSYAIPPVYESLVISATA